MLSPESLQIQSYLFASKTAQGASASLAEQRAWFDVMVKKYTGHALNMSCYFSHLKTTLQL
jgi:hypothetical protein